MSHVVITVSPQDNLKTALERTEWAGRHIPVLNNGKIVGIITDRDIRLALNSPYILRERLQDKRLLEKTPVAACMTPNPIIVEETATLYEAVDLMLRHKISGLPVINADKELVGIITSTDLLRQMSLMLKGGIHV
jgi:acetoin utilization protein AcuB